MPILGIIYENCTGCHLCELACSYTHGGVFNPLLSRITVLTKPEVQTSVPVYCLQCRDAACERVCPVDAIHLDGKVGAYVIDYSRCIGCRECAYACPFGAISFDFDVSPIKCDLCGGEPECAQVCPHDAIIYGPEEKVMRELKKAKAAGVSYGIYGQLSGEPSPYRTKKAEEATKLLREIWKRNEGLEL